jgi:hypothetical protein
MTKIKPKAVVRYQFSAVAESHSLTLLKTRDLPRFCPIAKMIEAAGTRIETEWVIVRP